MKALVVACHPDDEVLGCGGAIRLHALRGDEVRVLLLTGGAQGRYGDEQARALLDGARKAADILGADLTLADLPNQRLDAVPLADVIAPIEEAIASFRPARLYIHHQGDLNLDHAVAARASLTAARPLHGACVREVWSYFVASSSEWNAAEPHTAFLPNIYLDIEPVMQAKLDAMACYPSECRPWPHPRSAGALKAYAARFGLEAGLTCAEPFRLLRRVADAP